MSTQLLMAIAALCGSPSMYGIGSYSPAEVLTCQKYYINCYRKGDEQRFESNVLADCVLTKQNLGGNK